MNYKYTLPEDGEEVIVSGISMAILDIAKQPPLPDARAIQERALYHCKMTHKRIRGHMLTNDYEGFKQLFISSYAPSMNVSHLNCRKPCAIVSTDIRSRLRWQRSATS